MSTDRTIPFINKETFDQNRMDQMYQFPAQQKFVSVKLLSIFPRSCGQWKHTLLCDTSN